MLSDLMVLADYLIKLLEADEVQRRDFFDRIVTPTYEKAAIVFRDYLKLFADLQEQLQGAAPYPMILDIIKRRRIETLSERSFLRGLLSRRELWISENLGQFERGLFGVLSGGFRTDEGELHYYYTDFKHHALMDIYKFLGEGPVAPDRDKAAAYIEDQEIAIKHAWDDLEKAHSAMRSELLEKGRFHLRMRSQV